MKFETLGQSDNVRALAISEKVTYSEAENMINNKEYESLTYEEAYEQAKTYIKESLWAFNQRFIAKFSTVASAIPNDTWQKMAGELCEDFNSAVYAMIASESSIEDFIDEAIETDGLGHFLSTYDDSCEESEDFCPKGCHLDDNYVVFRL